MKSVRQWMPAVLGLVLLLALLVAACAPAAAPTATPTKAPAAATTPQAASTAATQATPATKPTTAAQATPPAKATTVKFGSPGSVSDAGVYIAVEKGYFKELGLDVQVLPFQSGPTMIAPLAAGELDVAGGTISTALLNAIDRGVALKAVAGKGSSTKGFEFSQVNPRKDLADSGQIKEIKDLKGKKISCSSAKSGCESQVAYLLKRGGLTINDIELVAMAYPDMMAALANKAVDAAQLIEPTLSAAVEQGLAVVWDKGFSSDSYGGEYQAAILVYSEQFTKNVDAARRFMVGYVKGERDYNDAFAKGKNKSDIVNILIKYTAQKDPALYNKMQMPYLEPNGKNNMNSLQMDLDYFIQMGYYTGPVKKVDSIVDNQFADYAVQQLGAYK